MEPPCNIEKITADESNRRILHLLKRNDPRLDFLAVADDDRTGVSSDSSHTPYSFAHGGLEWLGYFLSTAEHVQRLEITGITDRRMASTGIEYEIGQFFVGLSLNKSITEIMLHRIDLYGGKFFEKLIPFFKSNKRLASLHVEECDLGEDGPQFLAAALSECQPGSLHTCILEFEREVGSNDAVRIVTALSMQTNLSFLSFQNMQLGRAVCMGIANLVQNPASALSNLTLILEEIGDDDLVNMADVQMDTRKLQALYLRCNDRISMKGLRVILALLKTSTFNVQEIKLPGINFDDKKAIMFADSLVNNTTLVHLKFNRYSCTFKGWHTISHLLFNTSSIQGTFLSNHTLTYLGATSFAGLAANQDEYLPHDVRSYLALNCRYQAHNRTWTTPKSRAMNKILMHHHEFDMKPLFEWDFKMLPVAVNWFERARVLPRNFEVDVDRRKLSSIYQFVRGMPDLYIDSCLGLKNKKSPATKKPRRSRSRTSRTI